MKTALITGASRGIGRAIAIALAKEGYRVALNYYQSRAAAANLMTEIIGEGGQALIIQADVANRYEVNQMVTHVKQKMGTIDLLVNNAGIAASQLVTDITEEEWDRIFAVNMKGMFNCCQAVLPQMIQEKKGQIINMASIWGMVGAACETHYSASKGAVIAFSKALAKEVAPSNIQVNTVAPGAIKTDMLQGFSQEELADFTENIPLNRIGDPEDVANIVTFLASQKNKYMTGQVISPNGGVVI